MFVLSLLLISSSKDFRMKCDKPAGLTTDKIPTIHSYPSRSPLFKQQEVIKQSGIFKFDKNNSLLVQHELLTSNQLTEYLSGAANITRFSGKAVFNSVKPRHEVCYTVSGEPYCYSRLLQPTICYPPHVLNIVPAILEAVESSFPDNKYKELSNGVDILYSNEFVRGGSMGAHSDDEMHWGLVVIFSLGQTRWLRVRRKSNGAFFNVEMRHNSLIAMHGCSFQQLYTHQVDKLYKEEEVQCRLSLNLRFKEVDSVLPEVVVVPSIDSNITTQKKRKRPSSTVQTD